MDASVGVKWFRDEAGSDDARALVARHIAGQIVLVADSLFFYEVLRAASRDHRPDDARRLWNDLARLDIVMVPLGKELVDAAVQARETLGCALYDAFAAGLSTLLDAPLYSADARAHGTHPNVVLLGP